jgi:putative ABC transport system permease protein
MFVAIRDLFFARGRFALMGAVVALLTLMVVLLSGLTAGLGRSSTSAILDLPADHLVFAAPPAGSSLSFTDSQVEGSALQGFSQVPGVDSAHTLSISMDRATGPDGTIASVAAFGVTDGSPLPPAPVTSGSAVLSTGAATAIGATVGSRITVAGEQLTVTAIKGDDQFSHADVVWTMAPKGAPATVIALTTHSGADLITGLAAADTRWHTQTVATPDAVSAIGSYSAENGSLQLMRGLLLAISALVVGAFFTVWTVQRSADIAVLKALGSSTGYLLKDALGQAFLLLLTGTAVGSGIAAGLGALAAGVVPFEVSILTVVIPAVLMIVLGIAGAAASLRRVTSVDPLAALGSAR